MKQPLESERHQGEATRRDFLKGIAALGAGIVGSASLAACSPSGNDASKIPTTGADGAWDEETDVVIVAEAARAGPPHGPPQMQAPQLSCSRRVKWAEETRGFPEA